MKKSLLTALLGISALTSAIAQNAFNASGPGEQQATIFNDYGFPNSYTIDYSPFCGGGPCATTKKQLTAMVADDGVSAKLYVDDQTAAPGTPWPSITLPSGGGSAPDVVIGNDFSAPGCYIAGVTAVTGGVVMLYLYRIKNVGVGGGTLVIAGLLGTINVSGSAPNAVPPAHIDLACSSANPYMGLPNADALVITWQDVTQGIMGYANTLNSPSTTAIPQVVDGNLSLSNPDVAYVERGTAATKVAEFSYFDLSSSPNALYYSEWQTIPWIPLTGAITYDNTQTYYNPFPGMVSVGRIDGIDDYNKNAPGGGNAVFCVAASAVTGSSVSVFEYNDITGPGIATNITAPVVLPGGGIAGCKNQIPVVASGTGRFYSVGFYSDPISSSGGAQKMYYAVAVRWSTGLPLAFPNNNAYGIMSGSYDPMYTPGLCLSATCNTNVTGVQDLFAGFENYAFLWYKYSMPIPYSFKEAPTTPAAVAEAGSDWQVYPNPVSDHVTLLAPTGFNTKNAANYELTDIGGKTLQGNTIENTSQQINVSSLPAGSYLLNVHEGAKEIKTIKFVKE